MTREAFLACAACGATTRFDVRYLECRACGGPLMAEPGGARGIRIDRRPIRGTKGIWRFGPLLPGPVRHGVTLGEGDTPVVHLANVGRRVGHPRLLAKLESLNPTGSFKDRGSATLVTALREAGQRRFIVDSSGNAGASLAAYGAKAALVVHVCVPAEAPAGKVAAIQAYGAHLIRVPGGRARVADAARRYATRHGICYASANHHPLFLEGMKTYAYELVEMFGDDLPAHLIFPAGNGSLLVGVWRALLDLQERGLVRRLPRIHCIQSRGCMPLAVAFARGLAEPPDLPVETTVADGLVLRRPPRGRQVLEAVRTTGGQVVAVSDRAILAAQRLLARADGVYAEPSAAAALAGAALLVRRGFLRPRDSSLLAITGTGLKTVASAEVRS